jgi:hypothetical protein
MEVADCRNPAATIAPPSDQPPKSSSRHAAQRSHSARPASQTFTDTLPAAMQSQDAASEVTYSVEVLNRNARSAGFSNQVHVPAIATVPPPADLSVNLTGDGVILSWTSAGDSATQWPRVQLRYRIYRRDESSGKDAIAGEIPFGESGPTSFTDTGFEWENTYLYRVTAVSILQRPGGEVQVEGDDTPPHRVVAHDVFPPATPTGLQAAYSGEGQKPFIDLIWAPVTNADLDGYNVYRSESNSTSVKPNMLKQNSSLVKSPAYRDSRVAPGKTYTYCVSAVDARRNESSCSEPASEPVP